MFAFGSYVGDPSAKSDAIYGIRQRDIQIAICFVVISRQHIFLIPLSVCLFFLSEAYVSEAFQLFL